MQRSLYGENTAKQRAEEEMRLFRKSCCIIKGLCAAICKYAANFWHIFMPKIRTTIASLEGVWKRKKYYCAKYIKPILFSIVGSLIALIFTIMYTDCSKTKRFEQILATAVEQIENNKINLESSEKYLESWQKGSKLIFNVDTGPIYVLLYDEKFASFADGESLRRSLIGYVDSIKCIESIVNAINNGHKPNSSQLVIYGKIIKNNISFSNILIERLGKGNKRF